MPTSEPRGLTRLRAIIDRVDDALVVLFGVRRRLVRSAARVKRRYRLGGRDFVREAQMQVRAQSLARRIDLPEDTARGVLDLAIADACRLQGLDSDLDQGVDRPVPGTMLLTVPTDDSIEGVPTMRWLRWLPPAARLAPLLRWFPLHWQQAALEWAVARALAAPLANGALDFMAGHRLGIAVTDLGLGWVFELREGHLRCTEQAAETTVKGSATDLLLLASRIEDADTLFFQRRLQLTGDTELGLTARNMLDRLPWESLPLGMRILLHRSARLAAAARAAHRGEPQVKLP